MKIDEIEPTSVGLSWKAPANDGGSPIKHYIIEAKTAKDADWVKVGKLFGIFELLVFALQLGAYSFAVVLCFR